MKLFAKIATVAASLMLVIGSTAVQARAGLIATNYSGICASSPAGCVLPVKAAPAAPAAAEEAAAVAAEEGGFPIILSLIAAAAVVGGIIILADDDDDIPTSP
ncbi:hypothetical protein ACR9YC_07285 [Parasphingorhabdus sp. DH2-15]|jgi:hypothetical protein|uniref:hypothetical protein n=1 Tax=Parasphingorhabdus sp. DH2-15 TaxID=3444112 RepID=UPI003F682445